MARVGAGSSGWTALVVTLISDNDLVPTNPTQNLCVRDRRGIAPPSRRRRFGEVSP